MSGNQVDRPADFRDRAAYGKSDFRVFGVDDAGNLDARLEIKIGRSRIWALRGQIVQRSLFHAEWPELGRDMASAIAS